MSKKLSYLSNRVQKIKPSATLTIITKTNELKASGVNIISMSSGEPDFNTPKNIQQKAIEAMYQGQTKYTAVDGIKELKLAIIDKFKKNNLQYSLDEVMVSNGGKQVFYNLCQALLNKNNEVIIPAPYWVSYPDMVILADATPIIINTDIKQNFKVTPEQLEAHISPNSKLFVINSPSNPTGVIYTQQELKALAKVLKKHPQIFIITDDIYEYIRWDKADFTNIVMADNSLKDRTIILNGVSKAYAMTGWRIGYGAGPKDIIKSMKKIQGQSTSNPCSIAQAAALEALTGDQSIIKTMVTSFKKRHDFLVNELNKINGIQCINVQGAFYCFAKVDKLIERLGLKDDVELSQFLLEELNIAIVPGTAFGATGYIRLSFATSMQNIKETIKRLQKI